MYIFYEVDNAYVEVILQESNFIGEAKKNISTIIDFFQPYENSTLKIHPETKKEGEWMLQAYCELVASKKTIPSWLSSYLNSGFSLILSGEPVAKALNLVNKPHRPAESAIAERNQKIYSDVLNLMKNGMSLFDAALELSEIYKLHESNIQKIYSAIKKSKTPPEHPDDYLDIPF